MPYRQKLRQKRSVLQCTGLGCRNLPTAVLFMCPLNNEPISHNCSSKTPSGHTDFQHYIAWFLNWQLNRGLHLFIVAKVPGWVVLFSSHFVHFHFGINYIEAAASLQTLAVAAEMKGRWSVTVQVILCPYNNTRLNFFLLINAAMSKHHFANNIKLMAYPLKTYKTKRKKI